MTIWFCALDLEDDGENEWLTILNPKVTDDASRVNTTYVPEPGLDDDGLQLSRVAAQMSINDDQSGMHPTYFTIQVFF